MLGQKNYIDERIEKQQTMTVSNGYAWTRPNHIDDAIAKADFLDYQLKFAGQAWGYLEFNTQTEQYGNCLLIIKGKQRIKDKFPQIQKSRSGYLYEYSEINSPYLEKYSIIDNADVTPFSVQLELISDKMLSAISEETDQLEIDHFLIVAYEADSENNIVSVQVLMPDARTGQLHLIQDLSEFILTSPYQLSDEVYQNQPNFSELSDEETESFDIIPRTVAEEQQN